MFLDFVARQKNGMVEAGDLLAGRVQARCEVAVEMERNRHLRKCLRRREER